MFLAHYTGSGLNEVLEYDVDFFEESLKSSLEQYELERQSPVKAVVLGFAKGGN